MSSLSWEKGSMSFLTALRILCSDRNRWQSSARQQYEGEKARCGPGLSRVRGRPTVQKHEVVEGQQPLLKHMRLIRAHLPKKTHQKLRSKIITLADDGWCGIVRRSRLFLPSRCA